MSLYDTDRNNGLGFQYSLANTSQYTMTVSTPDIIKMRALTQDLFFEPLAEGTTEIYIYH